MSSLFAPVTGFRNTPLTLAEERALLTRGWLVSLPQELRCTMVNNCAVWHVPPGQVLGSQGSVPDVWFGVAAGAVQLSACSTSGREFILDLLEPGQWFGDMPLLECSPQPYASQTWSACTLLVMRRSQLRQLLASHAELGTALARLNWERWQRLLGRAQQLAEVSLRERLRLQLFELANRFGLADTGGKRIELRFTQQELANLVGASRQRANETLKALEASGEIRRGRGYVECVTLSAGSHAGAPTSGG